MYFANQADAACINMTFGSTRDRALYTRTEMEVTASAKADLLPRGRDGTGSHRNRAERRGGRRKLAAIWNRPTPSWRPEAEMHGEAPYTSGSFLAALALIAVAAAVGMATGTTSETLTGAFAFLTGLGTYTALRRGTAGGWALTTSRVCWPITTAAAAALAGAGEPAIYPACSCGTRRRKTLKTSLR